MKITLQKVLVLPVLFGLAIISSVLIQGRQPRPAQAGYEPYYLTANEHYKTMQAVSEFLAAARAQDIEQAASYWYGKHGREELAGIMTVLNKTARHEHVGSSMLYKSESYEPIYPVETAQFFQVNLSADPKWFEEQWKRNERIMREQYRAFVGDQLVEISFMLEVDKDEKSYIREIQIRAPKELLKELNKEMPDSGKDTYNRDQD